MASANTYNYNGNNYDITIIRKNNKNTYLRVKDSKIIITTNYFVTNTQINKLINNNTNFINKCLDKEIKRKENTSFMLFGKAYDIIYGLFDTEIEDNKIYTKDEKSLTKYLNKYIYDIFYDRLIYWYNLFEENIPEPTLKIRKMTSRWGVCNIKTKNITLNYELSKYEIKALDYVIVHELSHLIEANHSKKFWMIVSKYYPNYKEIRKMLKN